MKYELRSYQKQVDTDCDKFIHESAHTKGIIVNPVGTGKSLIPAMIAEKTDKKCLVIQPSIELLEQNLEKARSFGLDPSVYSASAKSKEISNLTYATPMSVVKNEVDFKDFDFVIVDECHLNMSNSMKNGQVDKKGKFNQFVEFIKPEKIIGLTATPIQLVTTGMGSELKMLNRSKRSYFFGSDIFHVTQIEDIHEPYWGDISTEIIANDTSVLAKARYNSPEFTQESIVKQYDENALDRQILEQYERMRSEGIGKVLTFVPSVGQAVALQKRNKDFEVVYDKTPPKERKAIVDAFKRGDIGNLLNCMIFTAGYDDPELDGLIMARNTNSFQLYYQIYGRIVRPIYSDGNIIKKKGIVVDLTGNSERFGDVHDITFEKNDYTNGWAMWNKDSQLTGTVFGNWDMPQRKDLIKKFEKKGVIDIRSQVKNSVIKIGKYKGTDLETSFKKDPRYFMWMYSEFDWSNPYNKPLLEPLEQLIEKNRMHGE